MQMKLPGDQAPIWTGQEDLLHLVPPPSIALTRLGAVKGPIMMERVTRISMCKLLLSFYFSRFSLSGTSVH